VTLVAPATIEASAPRASKSRAPNAYTLATIDWYGSPTITPVYPLACDQRSHAPPWRAWSSIDRAMSEATFGASSASNWTWER
jgi:hypothetical protein